MRFGENWNEFKNRPSGGGGGTNYIRAFKEGDTVVQFLTETDGWVGYLEHYNPTPGGFSFPCTGESDCPGCNSKLEKMKSKGAKVAITCLVDDKWVNVYRIPKKFADRIAKRAERYDPATLMDRQYIINRDGMDVTTDYDIVSGDLARLDPTTYDLPDVHKMLADTFNEAWPDVFDAPEGEAVRMVGQMKAPMGTSKSNEVFAEGDLRAMSAEDLKGLLREQGEDMPDDIELSEDTNVIVDWLLNRVPF